MRAGAAALSAAVSRPGSADSRTGRPCAASCAVRPLRLYYTSIPQFPLFPTFRFKQRGVHASALRRPPSRENPLRLKPSPRHQRVEQVVSCGSIEPLTERVAADLFTRDLLLALRSDPLQHAARISVAIGQSNLPESCPRVRPKVLLPQLDRGCYEALIDFARLQAVSDRANT